MYQTILVPLDGSKLAERAVPYAMFLAKAASATLVLVQAVEAATAHAGDPKRTPAPSTGEAKAYLTGLAGRLARQGVETDIATPGDGAAAGILGEAGRRQADLIVMSTHGRSGLGRWVYGSVADEVMRRTEAPVLLIPAACAWQWRVDRTRRILLMLDGSTFAEVAIGPATALAAVLGAELVLLEVVEPIPVPVIDGYAMAVPELDPGTQIADARAYVEATAAKLRAKGRTVAACTEYGNAVATIVEVARREAVDAIALATHGSGGMTRLVMGSVATGTIQRATVPVLVVRPAEARVG